MKARNSIYILLLCCMSCHPKVQDPAYTAWIENPAQGLHNQVQLQGWVYDIQYKPYPYMLLKEKIRLDDKAAVARRMQQLKGTVWFNISIRVKDSEVNPLKYGVADLEEYNRRLDYFLNQAAGDLSLKYKGKVLAPVSYLFENNYGLIPCETMVVGFLLPEEEAPDQDMVLSYNDRIFRNGIIKSTFDKDHITDINSL